MKMTYFVNKWANKAIEEYKMSGDLASLVDEHFMLSFDKGAQMIEEIENVELAAKYNDLEEDEVQEMLINKVQEKIDALMVGFEVEETKEEAAEKVEIEQINETVLVTTPNGPFAVIIGKKFNIDYKDQHGEYYLEDLLFLGCGPAKDCLLFRNDRGDILHMEPQKVQRVTISLNTAMTNEEAHLILELEKEIEADLKPYVAPDIVKTFAIKAAINGDRLVRAIKENEPWTDEDSLVSSGVLIRNNHTDATLYLSETYILEYLDKVSGKIFVISDLFYRGHYKDFLLFNKNGSYWVLMADQVKKVVQQDKFLGGAF